MSDGKSFFQTVSERHEQLKKRIHNFRMPLGPFGRFVMSCVYFSIPLVGGYYIMEVVKLQAEKNLRHIEKPSSHYNRETWEQNNAFQKVLDEAAGQKSSENSS